MKIVEKALGRAGSGKRKLETQVLTSAQGKRLKAPRLDADSATFSEDLLESFVRNVNRVRRENKAIFGRRGGSSDGGEV
jgi:hypothetical protein